MSSLKERIELLEGDLTATQLQADTITAARDTAVRRPVPGSTSISSSSTPTLRTVMQAVCPAARTPIPRVGEAPLRQSGRVGR